MSCVLFSGPVLFLPSLYLLLVFFAHVILAVFPEFHPGLYFSFCISLWPVLTVLFLALFIAWILIFLDQSSHI